MSEGPLAGVRILDLTRLLPGGFATLMLADLGADVVKVEEVGRGDYVRWSPPMAGDFSAGHVALNRNKRSVTLNLKSERGVELLKKLVRRYDVLVESFRPGVMERLGVGWEALRREHEGLIYCAITGYGQDGPRAGVAGHDINYIGYSGVLEITGDERPVPPGVQIGDIGGGAMGAAIAVLAALYRRSRTGRGDICDISMADAALSWLSIHAAGYFATGEPPERGRMPLSGGYPCYRVYPAADGWITVGALEPQFWAALCEALDRPDLLGDAYAMGERRDEVIAELEKVFTARTRAQWLQLFADRDVCVGPVNDFGEAFEDPQARHREMVISQDVRGVGQWHYLGNPLKLASASDPPIRRPPPYLGEHNAEVLAEVGIDEHELDELAATGVV